MIYVTIEKNEKDEITSFKVEGHAGYAPSGQDIVCSAVSALVIGTINGLEVLSDATIEVAMSSSGPIKVFVNKSTSSSNILLESMIMSLEGIQDEYPEFINIKLSCYGSLLTY